MVQDAAGEAKTTNTAKAEAIEDLLIGSGGEAFREIERRIFRFCPFEAIGMVRQEIRHARFLSFILDPNRPHPFHDHLLKAFLQVASDRARKVSLDVPLAIHRPDCSAALIHRERDNIDIMVEIPPASRISGEKGLVVAVELKIDAAESAHQLGKYRKQVLAGYPSDEWDHLFVFLTKDEAAPSEANIDAWIPVGLADVIDSFDQMVKAQSLVGEAVDLYRKYSAMIRRHLVEDKDLARLARSIWGKHREALEVLYEYRPDLQGEVISWLGDNSARLIASVREKTGFTLSTDTSSRRILRYSVDDWQDIPRFREGERNWVATGSLMVIELTDVGGGRLRASFVLGPGPDDIRQNVYREIQDLADGGDIGIGRRTSRLGPFKHLSAGDVQTGAEYLRAEADGGSAEDLGETVIKCLAAFLQGHMQAYDKALRKVLDS